MSANDTETSRRTDRNLTDRRSGPVRYELIDKDGQSHGEWSTVSAAAAYAKSRWPDQEQDEDRTGRGWDIQVVGCDR